MEVYITISTAITGTKIVKKKDEVEKRRDGLKKGSETEKQKRR